ncbi:hypothetical protein MMC28_003833 [Mycoblastus sanguinarius]|nr:hypothetical protein [Mycoblastus sanguinarius]
MDTPGRSQPKPTRIAVLLLASAQLLDVSPIDLFSMLTHEYLTACRLPGPLVAGAIPSEIIYVSEAGSSSIVECTASAGLRVNASISDTIAAPGQTDILLIPGPDPSTIPGELVKAFIKAHAEKGTIVMTVCTGVFPAAYAGVLEGKRATGPRALLSDLKTKFPGTKWEDKRWVHDGNIWCSAGITNGLDMVAAYVRENWPGPTAEAVLAMADVGERGEQYGSSKAGENAWWLWQILRAWISGPRKS